MKPKRNLIKTKNTRIITVGGVFHNLPHLKTYRKELRKNMTPAEAKLWSMLKVKQLHGRKFRRQLSIGNYILDFYCPSERIAIELDGHTHFDTNQIEQDEERDTFLDSLGLIVLRFENRFIWEDTEGVLLEIVSHFRT
jgi:very-short-patch-repair endonuclease